jgi:hypothetical protein
MKYEILIFSNSSYKHIWPIINDKTKNLPKITFCVDYDDNFIFNNNINLVFYNKTQTYTQRLCSILEKIDTDYVLLIHDIDIIINFNIDLFDKYFSLVQYNNIDRLSLGIFNNTQGSIIKNDNVEICELYENMSNNFLTPFDYAPSLYKKTTIYNFYKTFFDENYQTLEHNKTAQNYIIENLKCYGIQKHNNLKLIYHRGFVYCEDFNFLHLTVKGKFLLKEFYYDLINEYELLKNAYNLNHIQVEYTNFINKNEI